MIMYYPPNRFSNNFMNANSFDNPIDVDGAPDDFPSTSSQHPSDGALFPHDSVSWADSLSTSMIPTFPPYWLTASSALPPMDDNDINDLELEMVSISDNRNLLPTEDDLARYPSYDNDYVPVDSDSDSLESVLMHEDYELLDYHHVDKDNHTVDLDIADDDDDSASDISSLSMPNTPVFGPLRKAALLQFDLLEASEPPTLDEKPSLLPSNQLTDVNGLCTAS